MLQLPQVLARVPKSLSTVDNGTLAADVFTLVRGKKRKRTELAVAVNGEAINLYDIQASSLITSYSVPAAATFTCPPHSVRLKREEGPNVRLTYCSLADPKPRIQYFTEKSPTNHASHGEISTASHDLAGITSPVVFLQTMKMPKPEIGAPDIALVAVHEDGAIRCFTENLSEELWISASGTRTNARENSNTRVLCATVLDAEEARSGILKNRQDILVKLLGVKDLPGTDNGVSDLLVILVQYLGTGTARNTIEMELYRTRASRSKSELFPYGLRHSAIEQLVSFQITDPDLLYKHKSSYLIHAGSGTLYHSKGKSLRLYDFTTTLPRLAQHLQLKNRIHSWLRLSPSSVAFATSAYISIMDSHYQAVLSIIPLEPSPEDSGASPSTKHIWRNDKIRLLTYFPSMGIIVALQGRNLISYQLSDSTSTYAGGSKRALSGKLIDAIGRGIRNSPLKSAAPTEDCNILETFGTRLDADTTDQRWEELKAQINVLVSNDKTEDFDALVAADILLQQNGTKNEIMIGKPSETSAQKQRYPRTKLLYLISKMFEVKDNLKSSDDTSTLQSSLTIAFFPRKFFHWLIANDCFSRQYIESVLRQSGKLQPYAALQPRAMIFALVEFDGSLRDLLRLLESPSFLSARELVYAVRIAMEYLRSDDKVPNQKLLTNGEVRGTPESDVEMQLVNGPLEHDLRSTLKSEKGSNAHQLIRYVLVRLHNFHESDIREALRTELPHPALLSFVDVLRVDLAQGGWLSCYVDGEEVPIRDQANCTINIAIKLFNCAIDCLGTGGWISGAMNTATDGNVDTIAYMKAEVSAALEGIEEAAYLKSMLNEILLYSKTVKKRPRETRNEDSSLTRPITVAVQTSDDNVLPLGLKANQAPSLTKIGAGGEIQERNMRDVGRLKSREVGAYSFERIII
ncbi:hypothetical protein MMC26_000807 [Xylographa opegraphella]|nr:hypothetical protein [Xylographa opegraphella]